MVQLILVSSVVLAVIIVLIRLMPPKAADPQQTGVYVSAEVIVDWLCDQISSQLHVDPRVDALMLKRVQDVAVEAQKELMTTASYEVSLPFLTADSKGPKHFHMLATKAEIVGWKKRLNSDVRFPLP